VRDRGAAFVLLVFGLIALEEARKLRFGTIAKPGPGFFPVVLSFAFCAVCVVLLMAAWRARAGDAPAGLGWRKIVATMAALFVYAFLLEPAGFVIATFALLLFFFRALERQRWVLAVTGSFVTAFVTYLVFKVWLQVQLPPGPGGG
jgi:putative tricarboxylic transport membrane protein